MLPLPLALWLGSLAPPAAAHVPHDVVTSMAPPADLDPTGTWVVTSAAHVPMLHRRNSRDFYDIFGAEPLGDAPVWAGQLSDGTVLLVGETSLWWSADLEAWDRADLPGAARSMAVHQDQIALGGPSGVWLGEPGLMEQIYTGNVARISSGGTLALVDGAGVVQVFEDAGWTALPTVDGEVVSVLATADYTWVGTRDGRVLRLGDGPWLACESLPTEGAEQGDVVVLAVDLHDPEVLYVGVGLGGPFRSLDACDSFEDRGTGSTVVYGGSGSPEDETQGVTAILASGDELVLTGWNGIFHSYDGGLSWVERPLLPADYLRGLDLRPTGDGGVVIYTGPYATGPLRTDDRGLSWRGVNVGLAHLNVQSVAIDPFDLDLVYAEVGHKGHVSRDGGERWALMAPTDIAQYDPDEVVPDEVWGYSATGTLRSLDAGETWAGVHELEAEGRFSRHFRPAEGVECVVTSNPGELWCDEGEGWSLVTELGEVVREARLWDGTFLIATNTTVLAVQDGAQEVLLGPLTRDKLLSLAVADDGTLFAGTLGGLVHRSQDGGATWEQLPGRVGGTAWNLAPMPSFAEDDTVLVGTLDGSYALLDASGPAAEVRLRRWAPVQRVDDSSGYFTRDGCPNPTSDEAYDAGTWTSVPPGCRLGLTLRGEIVRVYGTSDGASEALLLVDGEERGTLGGEVIPTTGLLAEVEADGFAWHTVLVAGFGGEGLRIDAIEAVAAEVEDTGGDGGSADGGSADGGGSDGGGTDGGGSDGGATDGGGTDGGATDGGATDGGTTDGGSGDGGEDDDDGCNCATGGGATGLWALLGLLLVRRRRTTPARAR